MVQDVHSCKSGSDCHAKNHLCQIVVQKDFGRVKEIVKNAQYYCKNCGRAAAKEENLCNPSKI